MNNAIARLCHLFLQIYISENKRSKYMGKAFEALETSKLTGPASTMYCSLPSQLNSSYTCSGLQQTAPYEVSSKHPPKHSHHSTCLLFPTRPSSHHCVSLDSLLLQRTDHAGASSGELPSATGDILPSKILFISHDT